MTHSLANMSEAAAWNLARIAGGKRSLSDWSVFMLNTAMLLGLMLMMAARGCETAVPA